MRSLSVFSLSFVQPVMRVPPEIFPWISLEFKRCRLWARLAWPTRSHSQALSRCGLPKTARKEVAEDSSGSWIARAPGGRPPKAVGEPGTCTRASGLHSAFTRFGYERHWFG